MGTFFHRSRLSLWIACLAILLNALAPSVSHAIAASKGKAPSLIEICSAAGSRFVTVDDAGQPVAPADQDQSDRHHADDAARHCPFCVTHGGGDGLPPAALSVLHPAPGQAAMPRLFYLAPKPLFSWSAASPRGPPSA